MNKKTIVGALAVLIFLLIETQTVTAQIIPGILDLLKEIQESSANNNKSLSSKDLLKEGDNYFKKGDYNKAIDSYQSIIDLYPNSKEANDAKKKLQDKKIIAHINSGKYADYLVEKQERAAMGEQPQQVAAVQQKGAATQQQLRGTIQLYSPVAGAVLINGEASAFTAEADKVVNITVEDAPGKTITLSVRDTKGTVFQAFSKVTFEEQKPASTNTNTNTNTGKTSTGTINISEENKPRASTVTITRRGMTIGNKFVEVRELERAISETNTPLNKFAAIYDPNPPVNSGNDFDILQNAQGGITITKYTGSRRQVVIPETIEGFKVTEIGEGAFINVKKDKYSAIEQAVYTVFIPNTVTAIRNRAFKGQLLREVRIGNSVKTIGSEAFCGCYLTSLTIPNSVTEIGWDAFWNNAINSLNLGNGLVEIDDGAFRFNVLTELSLPTSLRTIGFYAFEGNRITTLTIPRGVTKVGKEAFHITRLTTVSIPPTLTDFENAFGDDNAITTITIGVNITTKNLTQFNNNFSAFYEGQSRKAGTYSWSGRVWTTQ